MVVIAWQFSMEHDVSSHNKMSHKYLLKDIGDEYHYVLFCKVFESERKIFFHSFLVKS